MYESFFADISDSLMTQQEIPHQEDTHKKTCQTIFSASNMVQAGVIGWPNITTDINIIVTVIIW